MGYDVLYPRSACEFSSSPTTLIVHPLSKADLFITLGVKVIPVSVAVSVEVPRSELIAADREAWNRNGLMGTN